MEYFDVVDINRKNLNYTKNRGDKLLDNEYNVGVELWCFNNKSLLLTQRSKNKSHPLKWEVPGGCSQARESSTDTLIREINEEIGAKLKDNEFIYLDTKLYKKQFVDIYKTDKKIDISNIELQEDEVCNIKFVNKKEFEKMIQNSQIVPSVINRYELIKDKICKDW